MDQWNKPIHISKGLSTLIVFFVCLYTFSPLLGDYGQYMYGLMYRVFPEKVTPESIKTVYKNRPISILVVPGHDNEYSGTEYKGVRESDVTLETAKYLYNFLKYNPKFTTFTTRDFRTGEYGTVFQNYFKENRDSIEQYMSQHADTMQRFEELGLVEDKSTDNHISAKSEVRLRLYGINKWANENNIDIVLHIHYNDYPGRGSRPGKYSGFSIYVPEEQLPNSRVSLDIAKSVESELVTLIPKSDLPMEEDTVIETQELIAVGSNATRDSASLLIEYSYIYEPQLASLNTRALIFQELAYKTYRGIISYFDKYTGDVLPKTSLLPYDFKNDIDKVSKPDPDVLRMQTALVYDGLYPPAGKSFSDCPVTGIYGNCTTTSVKAFQEKYADAVLAPFGYKYGTGLVGEKTLEKLNELVR